MNKGILFILLFLLFPSLCFAGTSGYLFLGKYLEHGQKSLEDKDISYYAGVQAEFKFDLATLIIKETTFMRTIDEGGGYPKQINYLLGLKKRIGKLEIIFAHECRHPVDGRNGSWDAYKFNTLEGRLNF